MKVSFCTLGCKVNQYESEALAERMTDAGWEVVPFGQAADATVINTCAVTAEAERKARQMVRRAAAASPGAILAVTGCAAQLRPETFTGLQSVFHVIGNGRKAETAEAILSHFGEKTSPPLPTVLSDTFVLSSFEPMEIRKSERTRAYIKIEDGCDSRCSYCIIRRARGPVRSKGRDAVAAEAEKLVAAGYREIVLTGIEIAAYGKDLGCDLADLLADLDRIPGLVRIRLGSLDPALLRPAFIERLSGLSRLCPHFHLSLQSGCDRILAAMRRKSNTGQIREAVGLLRRVFPKSAFTADVIVGFPGESEEDFAATAAFLKELSLLDFHIFVFSPRPGTEAASLPNPVAPAISAAREKTLAALRADMRREVLSAHLGQTVEVLFEDFRNGLSIGHTANFLEVAAPTPHNAHNALAQVKLLSCDGLRLNGTVVRMPL